ncbi:MAG: AAA family ATPase [Firmicutes bacterium]|nr:AAA family ATPase [Bacillota bacterium]
MTRVYLVCADPPRSAIWRLLERAGFQVTGAADTLDAALRDAGDLVADVAVVHADTPGSVSAVNAVIQLRARRPDVRVVVLLAEVDPALTDAVMRAGVYDWVVGDEVETDLARLIEHPRSLADVLSVDATPESEAAKASFGPARPLRVWLATGQRLGQVFVQHLGRRFGDRLEVTRIVDSAKELLESDMNGVDGVIVGPTVVSSSGMDVPVFLRVLAIAVRGAAASALVLFGPDDPPDHVEKAREHGLMAAQGTRNERGQATFNLSLFDQFVDQMEKRPPREERRPSGGPLARVAEAAARGPAFLRRPEAQGADARPEREVVYVPSRVICFTSMSGGVGKSTVSAGLAALAASYGLRVALVDLDPMNTTSSDLFTQGSQTPNFGRPLVRLEDEDEAEITRRAIVDMGVTRRIGKGTVTVFRSRGPNDVPSALSGRMVRKVVDALRAEFQAVILDTHPLLLLEATYYAVAYAADVVYLVTTDTRDALAYAVEGRSLLMRILAGVTQGGERQTEPDLRLVVNRKTAGGYDVGSIRETLKMPVAAVIPDGGDQYKAALKALRPVSLADRPNGPWHALFVDAFGADALPQNVRGRWASRARDEGQQGFFGRLLGGRS